MSLDKEKKKKKKGENVCTKRREYDKLLSSN